MIGVPNNKLIAGNYTEQIEIINTEESGGWYDNTVNTASINVLANVQVLSGDKALRYREGALENPVIIETNHLSELPSAIRWNGVTIIPASFIDSDNHLQIRSVILGNIAKPE